MSIVLKITATKRKPCRSGNEYYWSIMMDREMRGETFSVDDIFDQSSCADRTIINSLLGKLAKADIIAATGDTNERGAPIYRVLVRRSTVPVINREGVVLHEHITAKQAIWNAMRSPVCRLGFSLADLILYASTDTLQIKPGPARNYIHFLTQAGYLTVIRRGTIKELPFWRLTRNTGPIAPKVLRSECVYDPNAEKIYGEARVKEIGQ